MLYFSYNDYYDLTENGKIDGILKVEEKKAKYIVNSSNSSYKKRSIVQILSDNIEMIKFINQFLYTKDIENVSLCNNVKIDIDKDNENNILYKVENKNIYLFIKQIDNIDVNISFKMLEYCLKIMKIAKNSEISNINPIIMPVVIYTGKAKWSLRTIQKDKKLKYTNYTRNRINLAYNVININDFSIEELQNKDSKIAEVFLEELLVRCVTS
jgi:hypothetical protein